MFCYSVQQSLNRVPLGVLLTLLIFMTAKCLGECRFPLYMQTLGEGPSWFVRYQNGNTVEISVKDNIMFLKDCRILPGDCKSIDRHCIKDYGHERYMVKEVIRRSEIYGNGYSFRCIQFIQRSKSVVQIRISKVVEKGTQSLCSDSVLLLDQYPMVSTEHLDEVTACPIVGGYDFQMYTPSSDKAVCDDILLPLRVESDCIRNEGMKFHFRRKRCVNAFIDKTLDDEIEVRCIAHWMYKGFIFSVVKWEKDRDFWCIRARYSRHGDQLTEVVVYFSGICPSNLRSQTNVLILRDFKKQYIDSVCADEAPKCEYGGKLCSSDKREHCKLTCKLCQPGEFEKSCTFPRMYVGNWHSLHDPRSNIVTITNSTLSQGNMSWQCVQSDETKMRRERVIKVAFKNGCYPRYMCLDLEIPALSVLRYRTGTQLSWPIDSLQTVCEDRYFSFKSLDEQPQVVPAGLPWSYFINETPDYVTCNLPWYISKISPFIMYDSNRTERHRGCLINDVGSSRHILKVVYTHNRNVWKTHTFLCLASLKFIGENDQLITQNADQGVYMCWTFVKGPWDNVFIYLYNATDCGNGTNMQLVHSHPAMVTLVIRPNASDCDFIEDKQRESIFRRDEVAVSELNNSGVALTMHNFICPTSLLVSWFFWLCCV